MHVKNKNCLKYNCFDHVIHDYKKKLLKKNIWFWKKFEKLTNLIFLIKVIKIQKQLLTFNFFVDEFFEFIDNDVFNF